MFVFSPTHTETTSLFFTLYTHFFSNQWLQPGAAHPVTKLTGTEEKFRRGIPIVFTPDVPFSSFCTLLTNLSLVATLSCPLAVPCSYPESHNYRRQRKERESWEERAKVTSLPMPPLLLANPSLVTTPSCPLVQISSHSVAHDPCFLLLSPSFPFFFLRAFSCFCFVFYCFLREAATTSSALRPSRVICRTL